MVKSMMWNTVSLNSDADFPKGNFERVEEKEMKYPNLGVELIYHVFWDLKKT